MPGQWSHQSVPEQPHIVPEPAFSNFPLTLVLSWSTCSESLLSHGHLHYTVPMSQFFHHACPNDINT